MKIKPKVKWYNDPQLVGALLFFLPPVGIFGLYKSEAIKPIWKKVASGALALACIMLFVISRT